MESDAGASTDVQDAQGGEQRIAVFLRLRPVPGNTGRVATNSEDGSVEFNVPKDSSQG
jgi:hypothetical protein